MSKRIKKINILLQQTLATIIAASVLIALMPLFLKAADSGNCGQDLNWMLEEGVLKISGSGSMQNFTEENMAPWYEKRMEIIEVVIEEGVTSIGDLAFYECMYIQAVTLPDSIVSIGSMSFAGCTSLLNVRFNEGLKSIGVKAFSRCESLSNLIFPDTLIKIGSQAFYRCSSLASIRVPEMVSMIGTGVFAYCTSLIQAIFEGMITELPVWTFYGCTSLVSVTLPQNLGKVGEYVFYDCNSLENIYCDSDENIKEMVKEQIQNISPTFAEVTERKNSSTSSIVLNTEKDIEGNIVQIEREVIEKDNASIDIVLKNTITNNNARTTQEVSINATINGNNGWVDLLDETTQYLTYPERMQNEMNDVNRVQVVVRLNDTVQVSSDILKKYAGKKVDLCIITKDNAKWIIDCESIDSSKLKDSYNLTYSLTKNASPTEEQKKLIGDAESYLIEFVQELPFNVTLVVRLGIPYSRLFASFCQQVSTQNWEILQSVLVEDTGYASFHLNTLKETVVYMIAVDVAFVGANEVFIPESLLSEYGGLVDEYGTKYVITGRKSSMGINIFQLTLIMGGVLFFSAVGIGTVMYILNKRHFKNEEYLYVDGGE